MLVLISLPSMTRKELDQRPVINGSMAHAHNTSGQESLSGRALERRRFQWQIIRGRREGWGHRTGNPRPDKEQRNTYLLSGRGRRP
jgi:hypothetical protein